MRRPSVRVLVIDDDPDIRDALRWLLEGEGFAVSVAANGAEGLTRQRREPADIVVTDIFMPEQDGIETLWKFRGEFPQVPIIVMSGGSSARGTDYLSVAHELGAQENAAQAARSSGADRGGASNQPLAG